jgi:hypothetical protein
MLGLANTNAAPKIVDGRAQIVDEAGLLGADSLGDAMEANVMLRSVGKRREWARIRTKLSSQPCDAVDARHLPVEMAGGVVEAEADSASKLVEKNVPAALAASRALEPRKCPVSPHHQDSVSVDPKAGAVSGELVPPVAPSQLCHRTVDEPADAIEHRRVKACAALDQVIEWDTGELIAVVQSKARHHERENISARAVGQVASYFS